MSLKECTVYWNEVAMADKTVGGFKEITKQCIFSHMGMHFYLELYAK